ncbi:DUF2752 domain-containing protein [Mycobacterium sp. MMS18-G62]
MNARSLAAPVGVAAAAAGGCVCVWLANPTVPGGILPVCPTKALLGIDCPGCGSLRMIYSLLHLDFTAAVRYNAVGMVAVLLLVWAFAAWTYGRVAGRQVLSWQHLRWSAPTALAVTLAWFVVRNLGFGPFSALYV